MPGCAWVFLPTPALKARKLAQADWLVVASPAYLARRGVPSTPADLLEHDGIIHGPKRGRAGMASPARHFGDIGIHQDALTLSAAEGVREAVLAGQDLRSLHSGCLLPEVKSGGMMRLLEFILPDG
jgi:DNA-binding transcriptional LysR family regulator